MDVSFNNILQDARQYFQGLPTATSANSSYPSAPEERQSNHYGVEQPQERTQTNSSYWTPHQEAQVRTPQSREHQDSIQRPPSHHSEQPQQSSLHGQTVNHQENLRSPTNNYHVQNVQQDHHSVPTSHASYQFTKPQHPSSSQPQQQQQHHQQISHVTQQQQYQSHILPNPSYYQVPQTSQQSQTRTAPTSAQSSQPYHSQVQQQAQPHSSQLYTNYQQSRSYYPPNSSQSQPYHQSYPAASSQSFPQSLQASYMHASYPSHSQQQHSYQSNGSYTASKASNPSIQEANNSKENQSGQQQTSQPYKTTHNLPPIAALSSLNYHSSRTSREISRIASNKPRVSSIPATTKSSSETPVVTHHASSRPPTSQYPTTSASNEYLNNNSQQQNRSSTNTTAYHYSPSNAIAQSSAQFTTTSVAASTTTAPQNQMLNNYSNFQSVSQQQQDAVTKTYQPSTNSNKLLHTQQSTNNQNSVQSNSNNNVNSSNNSSLPTTKQKRESPLDLSVKTVRTSADSTFNDQEANHNPNDHQRLSKYYQQSRPRQSPLHQQTATPYPSYDVYTSNVQRNYNAKSPQIPSVPAASIPKVDFFPNFNIPAMHQSGANKLDVRRMASTIPTLSYEQNSRTAYDKKAPYFQPPSINNSSTSSSSTSGTVGNSNSRSANVSNSNSSVILPTKKPAANLPRVDFLPPTHKTSALYGVSSNDVPKKRPAEQNTATIPSKIPKVDAWRQTIDQQIEQRLSSYAKSLSQQDQSTKQPQQSQPNASSKQQVVNGNYVTPVTLQERAKEQPNFPPNYHRPQYSAIPNPQMYPNTNHYNHLSQISHHNQTYIPSVSTATARQFPNFAQNFHGSQQQQTAYTQHPSLTRTNSNPALPITSSASAINRNSLGADRRVLSLLRNSLEIKGAKEAQKKLEQEHQKPREQLQIPPIHRSDIQQPSTDVMAPLQPKPGVVGRHNMSPFAATSLFERNSNTPPTYKFHIPKAIDSIKFDAEVGSKDHRLMDKSNAKHNEAILNTAITNPNTELDGFAALIAARIRTKAELKQVGPSSNASISATHNFVRSSNETHLLGCKFPINQFGNDAYAALPSPPKLSREKAGAYLPRRRLFSRNEEDTNGVLMGNVPLRDKSGLRSSSETSVFDFPDSDSETEMPVLERQSLVDMRRDRKTYPKPISSENIGDVALGQQMFPMSPMDVSFDDACDKFVQQLKSGIGKKRGRRKKLMEPDVLAKLETVVTNEKPKSIPTLQDHDKEGNEKEDTRVTVFGANVKTEELEETNEGDLKESKIESDSDSDIPLSKCKNQPSRVTLHEDISTKKKAKDETCSDSSDSESETIKKLSDKHKEKKPRGISSNKSTPTKTKREPLGDGSDFYPGWEEEVYKYKRSLRMPPTLIHVTRPPMWNRLSTSLPDLDPCPNSPSPSENVSDFIKSKIKSELLDSDADSNSNFSILCNKTNYDSEEGSSSIKNCNAKSKHSNSILDRLIERYGPLKRSKKTKKKEGLTPKIIPKCNNEIELLATPSIEKTETKDESVLLGFRKNKGTDNQKGVHISSSNVGDQFQSVVLKPRTRQELRALKKKASIKEIFGEDRPASAPPVTCVDNTNDSQDGEDIENKEKMNLTFPTTGSNSSAYTKMAADFEQAKEAFKYKILNRGQKSNLFKEITNKKIKSEFLDDDVIKQEVDSGKSETPSLDGDDYSALPTKKRMKIFRRKFSSGFDYIRKKKKTVKKEGVEIEISSKIKRRGVAPKTSPESVQDIQKEIKMWVMNKGIGETHLHRAARLGYTDIIAYCLEKTESSASPKDNAGYTPLHEACSRGHLSIAKLLLLYGANASESAQGGIRPLHEAAENGFVEMVRLLLSYGADPMLATYSGLTPLSLATDEATVSLLKNHIADLQGEQSDIWNFLGPSSCFDTEDNGYNPLDDVPDDEPSSEDEDMEFELSDSALPNLYTIRGEPQNDKWILLQDLSNILKIKSRDALLRQINPTATTAASTSSNASVKSGILRELKMTDFLEQANCCQYLCAGEKINTRASKIALVKYSDKVRQLLGVEKIVIAAR